MLLKCDEVENNKILKWWYFLNIFKIYSNLKKIHNKVEKNKNVSTNYVYNKI